jgi:hypothetical protein
VLNTIVASASAGVAAAGSAEIGRAGLGAVDGGARPRDDGRAVAAGDQGVDDRAADGPGAEHQWSLEAGGGHGGHGCCSPGGLRISVVVRESNTV